MREGSGAVPDRTAGALAPMLDGCARHDPEYDEGLSNHLPMLLHALHELGASPARMAEAGGRYARRLSPATAGADAPPAQWPGWRSALGDYSARNALLRHFRFTVRERGVAAALRESLPALVPGVAAVAFHGLLRTAHGVAAGHDGEVAQGLAYWAARYQPSLAPAHRPAPALDFGQWSAALRRLRTGGEVAAIVASRGLIAARMAGVCELADFQRLAPALAVGDDTIAILARAGAALYARTKDFTILHAVTSAQAMIELAPFLPEPERAAREYSCAWAAALCSARFAAELDPPSPWPWPAIHAAAIASEEDHRAKLVAACRSLEARLGGEEFRIAATAGVQVEGTDAGKIPA
jgi:hypothetical protein